MIEKIRKRDGTIVDFDKNKIVEAIWKAAHSVGVKDRSLAEGLADQVVELLEKSLKPGEIPKVEQVQDLVEKVLVENGHYKIAKAYILYRQKRAEARKVKAALGIVDELKLPTNSLLILASRYLRRGENGKIVESTAQLFRRVAKAIAEVEKNYGKSDEEVKQLEEEFYRMMTNFEFLPNSPTLMNAGTGTKLTLSACFVIPIEDSIESIFNALKVMALVQKAGGGCIDGRAKLAFENDAEFHVLDMKGFYEKYKHNEFYDEGFDRYGVDVRDKQIYVYSFDPKSRELIKGKVQFIWKYVLNKGEEKYEIKTNKGTKILTSAWHPFFVVTPDFKIMQKRSDELRKGEMILGAIPPKIDAKFDFDYWLIGFITGDGSIGKYKNRITGYESDRIRIYDNRRETLEKINDHLERKFGKRYAIQRDRNIFYIDIKTPEVTSYYIKLKENVYKNKEAALSFIAGLFDAEGHVNSKPGVELSMTNKKQIETVMYFLNSIGIKARMRKRKREDGVDYIIHVEEYSSLLRFYELVGKKLQRVDKKEKLRTLLERHKGGSFGLPLDFNAFKKQMSRFGVKFKTNGNQTIAIVNGKKFSLGQWHKRGVVAKATLIKFLRKLKEIVKEEEVEKILRIVESLEVVKKISITRKDKVFYDLTVDKYQNYLAGDGGLLFVHNTGFSFSKIRPAGDIVKSTGGIASGPISFMKIFDAATEQIKQGGKRRGANMGILRVDHPDILDFIVCKEQEGVLRNFNISVAVTDKFMEAVKKDEDFELINPRNGEVVKKVKARAIWNLLVTMAWKNGEPGVVFIDRINEHCNTTPQLGRIESTNPCGEQPLLPYESCNLGSINLSKMLKEKEDGTYEIDWEKLRKTVRLAVRFLDNVIDANSYPVKEIEIMTKGNRKIGLGVMGFADMLILLRIPYNSEEALKIAEEIMKFISEEARKMSEELGKEKGNFPNFKGSKWDKLGYKYMRNANLTTIAPTGTISEIAGCSQGIEPLFAVAYVRNVAESLGYDLVVFNPYFEKIAIKEGFYDEAIMKKVLSSTSIQHIEEIPEEVRKVFVTAHDLKPEDHVRMQAAFQKYVDNAVSKTINFPYEATPNDVEKAYMLAYDLGCLGVTVYRFGSRKEQVLTPVGPRYGRCEACEG